MFDKVLSTTLVIMWKSKARFMSGELWVEVYKLWVQSHELQFWIYKIRAPRVTSSNPQVTSWNSQVKAAKGALTLSWRRLLSYRNQSTELQSRSIDWFLYHNDLREERVKGVYLSFHLLNDSWTRGFELVTRGFELVTCEFELMDLIS